jgi:hypothetical protein
MNPRREVLFYRDRAGRCEVADAIRALKDEKLQTKIRRRLLILGIWTWEELTVSETIVQLKGGDEIYELKLAGSGRWGIRLFFARSTCLGLEVLLITELDTRRALNRKGRYDAAIARATRLRAEWESRNC